MIHLSYGTKQSIALFQKLKFLSLLSKNSNPNFLMEVNEVGEAEFEAQDKASKVTVNRRRPNSSNETL